MPVGQPIKSAIWSFVMVLFEPVLNNAPGVLNRRKQPAVQAAVAQDAVKALVMPALLRTPRIHKAGLDMMRAQLCCHLLRNTLWTIVTFHIPWHLAGGTQALQDLDDLSRGNRPGAVHGSAFMGIFIQIWSWTQS